MGQENQLQKVKLRHQQSLKNNQMNIKPIPLKNNKKKTSPNISKLKLILILLCYSLVKKIQDTQQDPSIKVPKLLLTKLNRNSIKQILKNKDQKANNNQD